MRRALVLRHLAFEDLGRLQPALHAAGFEIRYVEVGVDAFEQISPVEPDVVIVLGGPVGAYDTDQYPYLATEVAWLRARLVEDLPTIGICLGAQLMAAALHAKVYPGSKGKEIGWAPLLAGGDSAHSSAFQRFLDSGAQVMHWHGDTFDLPAGARHLAATARYPQQAFTWGRHGLALQFHLEFDARQLERWLIGHSQEIAQAPGVTLAQLRRDTVVHAGAAQQAADAFWGQWLAGLAPRVRVCARAPLAA